MQRALVLAAYGAAIVAGLKYGYDFGKQISGPILGVVLAVNGALFCSIVVGMLVDRLQQLRGGDARRRDPPGT
ncbi:MAG: hypothetical protein AD742_09015 [Methylibium sp. NZG]|nr:MAG: hypothetical protein AD742_09015 [Methylibium sp. NZG]